jgi:hypothetical protein
MSLTILKEQPIKKNITDIRYNVKEKERNITDNVDGISQRNITDI